MNSQHLISIIVPCFNQAEFLDDCLTSVLKQSYSNWECLIINDGSTDDTALIAKKWVVKDSRFNYFEKQNGGLSSARNYGLENSKGEFILPLDADDKISKDYVSQGVKELISDKSVGVIYCDAEYFGKEKGKWEIGEFKKKELLLKNFIFCSAIYRKSDQQKIGGYDENLIYGHEDWEFWIRMIYENNLKVLKLNHTGFYYRVKDSSMIRELKKDKNKTEYTQKYIVSKHLEKYNQVYGDIFLILHTYDKYKDFTRLMDREGQDGIEIWLTKNIGYKALLSALMYKCKQIIKF